MQSPECSSEHIRKMDTDVANKFICMWAVDTSLSRTLKPSSANAMRSISYNPERIPALAELEALQTFIREHKNLDWKIVDHCRLGLLRWVVGDLSGQAFKPLWVSG